MIREKAILMSFNKKFYKYKILFFLQIITIKIINNINKNIN